MKRAKRRTAWHKIRFDTADTPRARLRVVFDWLTAEAVRAGPDAVRAETEALLERVAHLRLINDPTQQETDDDAD